MYSLVMPWPALKPLSPNWRGHWSVKAKAKKAYRSACALTAQSQGARSIKAAALRVEVEFFQPDGRHRDRDNMLASFKAGIDGLADVFKIDDYRWDLRPMWSQERGGMVKVRVWVWVAV